MRGCTALLLVLCWTQPGCRCDNDEPDAFGVTEEVRAQLTQQVLLPMGGISARVPASWSCDLSPRRPPRLTCLQPSHSMRVEWTVEVIEDARDQQARLAELAQADREGSYCVGRGLRKLADAEGTIIECHSLRARGENDSDLWFEGLSAQDGNRALKLTVYAHDGKRDRPLAAAIILSTRSVEVKQ